MISIIGIISDTHEQKNEIQKAVEFFKHKNVEFVIHAGDIVSPPMLNLFEGLKMRIIFGNNDGEKSGLNFFAKKLGFEPIEEMKEFTHDGKKFFVYHGTNHEILENAIKKQEYDYVITGHNHTMRNELVGKTHIINPGSLFSDVKSVALLDTEKGTVEFEKWD